MNTSSSAPRRASDALVEWANSESAWIRKLVTEVLTTKLTPSEDCILECLDVLLREKELRTPPAPIVPPLIAAVGLAPTVDPLRLTKLTVGDGVNALKAGQELEFGPGLTVIFGENGSGKSGYVRVLKRIAGIRTADPIISDINKPGDMVPSASIEFAVGKENGTHTWKNEQGLYPFNQIAIFDSRAAAVHVDELTYSYSPADLNLFEIVHDAIQTLESRLKAEVSALSSKGNPFLVHFQKGRPLYASIETLGASSDVNALAAHASFTDGDREKKEQLDHEISALKAQDSNAQLRLVEAELRLAGDIRKLSQLISTFDRTRYLAAITAVREAQSALSTATAGAFAGSDIPGILTDPWHRFIEEADRYLNSTDGHAHYPTADAPCLYCRQPLTTAAVTLVEKYRELASGSLKERLTKASEELRTITSTVQGLNPTGTLAALDVEVSEGRATALADCKAGLREAEQLRSAVVAESHELPALTHIADTTLKAERFIHSAQERAKELRSQGEQRDKHLADRVAQFDALKARETFSSLWPAIQKHVLNAKWVDRATQVQRSFQALRKGVTDASKAVAADLLNTSFEARFVEESKSLRVPAVQLNFPGSQGQPMRRKLLAKNRKPSEIWSEGEQKALALADFIAEAHVREPAGPVVFDDPINSLDYRRVEEVSARILNLARSRQVVVFTHNIWFVSLLIQHADKKGAIYYDIKADGEPGVLSRGTQPRLDSFTDQRKRLDKLIAAIKKADPAIQEDMSRTGYTILRGICETIVEHEVLAGVTRRYEPNVSLGRMDKIKFGKLEETKDKLLPIFDKACRYTEAHSQPREQLNIRPTVAELEADWLTIMSIHDEHKG